MRIGGRDEGKKVAEVRDQFEEGFVDVVRNYFALKHGRLE